jgi:hypothetical protein
MVIVLVVIGEYSIGGYWWILMDIYDYYINGNSDYSIESHWWLFYW